MRANYKYFTRTEILPELISKENCWKRGCTFKRVNKI